MIKKHCFQKEWIDGLKQQGKYNKINPPLVEKMIHALSLLQYLQTQGLSFIFKGGTSLILLLENAGRFSIDIDIITESDRETIEKILDRIVTVSHFKTWRLDGKRSYQSGVPKAHYELEYDSNLNKKSNYVLLDILFQKSHYPTLHRKPIQSIWMETNDEIEVTVPTIEAITGDKLTAFAPTTTGILYGKGKELEIIKQLFDLGNLFNEIKSMEQVATSFYAFVAQELAYRSLSLQPADILQDTINTCRIISFRESNRQEPERSRFTELQNGIRSFTNHLISGNFRIDEAVTASAKVAYLCSKLLRGELNPLQKYAGQEIKSLEIINQHWNVLNRLKRFPDSSAFYYWHKGLEVLNWLK